jgi:hypothetical protein
MRPRAFVTRQIFPEALDLIAGKANQEVWPGEYPPTPEQLNQKQLLRRGRVLAGPHFQVRFPSDQVQGFREDLAGNEGPRSHSGQPLSGVG